MVKGYVLGACVAFAVAQPALAQQSLAGSYLAARQAATDNDFKSASQYFTQAVARDPGNFALVENALSAHLALGQRDQALTLARVMLKQEANSQLAHMVAVVDDVAQGKFAALAASLDGQTRIGPLVDGLVRGWALIGDGQVDAGLGLFDQIADQQGLREFALYHKSLALGMLGEHGGGAAILVGQAEGPVTTTRRGAIAAAQMLSQLDRNVDAVQLIETTFGATTDETIAALVADLAAGTKLPFSQVTSAAQGAAEVFYTVAAALEGEGQDTYALIYARLADWLDPDHLDAVLLSARYLEALGRYDLATKSYDRVPRDDPAFVKAELGRAEALRADGRPDAAIEVLEQLAEAYPDTSDIHIKLGDTLRRLKRYGEAIVAYDRGLSLVEVDAEPLWFTYFARAISHERTANWSAAEADFRHALMLKPQQPSVLNYLGYSLVEKGQRLDEALKMIEVAAAARPESGHIQDSLGWVFYKLGRFDEAVDPMETAVSLMPTDAIINDHLGDVYWSVGRAQEARFQWLRALSFDPEEDEANRIRRKLEIGLDAVLQEEGAKPIAVAQDG